MVNGLTKKKLIEGLEHCARGGICSNCPLKANGCKRDGFKGMADLVLSYLRSEQEEQDKKKETVSEVAETVSSGLLSTDKTNLSYSYDTSFLKICQEKLENSMKCIFELRDELSEDGELAFVLGDIYRQVVDVSEILEDEVLKISMAGVKNEVKAQTLTDDYIELFDPCRYHTMGETSQSKECEADEQ
jgi:hypothetical protein